MLRAWKSDNYEIWKIIMWHLGKFQWLPEMPTGKTELKVSCLILDMVKRRAATGVVVSNEKGVNLSQGEATEWWPEMPTEKLTQNELHN